MKFHLSKEKLLEGLQQVQSVVSTRTTLPILSNVLLQTNGKGINMTTTDLDVGVRCNVEAEISEPGATTLPARRLFTIIRELPSSDVQFETDGKNVASIQSGQSFFKILGLPEEEFPPLPKFEGAKTFTLRQGELKDALKKTSYAISTDETRYVLNGILCSFKEGKLTLVATDGRRLAMVDLELEIPPATKPASSFPPRPSANCSGCSRTRATSNSGSARTRWRLNSTARCSFPS